MNEVESLVAVCRSLSASKPLQAAAILSEYYPFTSLPATTRRYGPRESTAVFVRDGFIDRYSGRPLIFPPVLRLVSKSLPSDFPFHPNWKMEVTHPAYWEVGATVDHLHPVTRGGKDELSNWVTTSMARNSAKMNWTLEQLGWELHPPGDFSEWDGLLNWFLEYADQHQELVGGSSLRQWHRAARQALDAL